MLDLDIFEENVFETVANNAMSKFLPTNADEFFDWYIGIYAKEHSYEYNLTEEKINILTNIKQYIGINNKAYRNYYIKKNTTPVMVGDNKKYVIKSFDVNYEYFENMPKDFYESRAAYIIKELCNDSYIISNETSSDMNEPITEQDFLQFMYDNADKFVDESCNRGYHTMEDSINEIKEYATYYITFRKMARANFRWGYHRVTINKSLLVKSTISSVENFMKMFAPIINYIK